MIPNISSVVGGGLTAGLGFIQWLNSKKALKELAKTPDPQYKLNSGVQNSIAEADRNRYQGFSAAERNAFDADLTRQNNTAYQRGINQAPQLSGAVSAAINGMNQNALLRYAAMDAEMRRKNLQYSDQLRGQGQVIDNLNTGVAIDRRRAAEQAYGNAGRVGSENIVNGLTLATGIFGDQRSSEPTMKEAYGYRDPVLAQPRSTSVPANNLFPDELDSGLDFYEYGRRKLYPPRVR